MSSSGKHNPVMGPRSSESKKEVECGLCPKYKARRDWMKGRYKNSILFYLGHQIAILSTFFVAKMIYAHFFVAKMIWAHLFCCKDDLHTLFFVAKTINAPFFVTKRIYAHFFIAKTIYAFFFVAKMIYALRPESFCALEVAIRKVQTFWASALRVLFWALSGESCLLSTFLSAFLSAFFGYSQARVLFWALFWAIF